MLDIPAPIVAHAIEILRVGGPMRAAEFARRMWPERCVDRTEGHQSQTGSPFLYQLRQVGYVQQVGDLWTLRMVGNADGLGDSAVRTADASAVGLPLQLPNGPPVGLPLQPPNGPPLGPPFAVPDPLVERQRLHRLVALATEPVPTVTHDRVLGDLAIRAVAVDAALVEACALTVLRGRSANIYLPCGAPQMIVGLSPAEGARALYLRWSQSGQPPELPREGAWIRVPDGVVASSSYWRPAGAPESWVDPEDVRVRVQRLRVSAGLA